MNYTVIKDKNQFASFIDWLPVLQEGECYYVSLMARNKYLPNRGDLPARAHLKRFDARSKDLLYEKVAQLEIEQGRYVYHTSSGTQIIPQESLALYIAPNPRSYEKAAKQAAIRLVTLMTAPYNGYNPHSEVMSEIQKACSRKVYFDFDYDGTEWTDFVAKITGRINLDCLQVLKTRGGFHVLVKLDKVEPQYNKRWYEALSWISGCDVRGDNLIPVQGCVQGDFVPRFIDNPFSLRSLR